MKLPNGSYDYMNSPEYIRDYGERDMLGPIYVHGTAHINIDTDLEACHAMAAQRQEDFEEQSNYFGE